MQDDAIITQQLICDYVTICWWVLKVSLSKELLAFAASARSEYKMDLDEKHSKKITGVKGIFRFLTH